METGAKVFLDRQYPSTLESVDQAEEEILRSAEEAGFDEDERLNIGMAVRECMVNAVVHGNRYNRNKLVHVGVWFRDAQFTIQITDQGEGFEVKEVPDPLDESNLLRHSGRGLFLMGAFMNEVKVRKGEVCGTTVKLVKNLAPPEGGRE